MFGTILHDEIRHDERAALHDALEELCSPLDTYGWASVGIYMFFDPLPGAPTVSSEADFAAQLANAGSQTLYLGLARDLPERFRQHAGLMACPARNCKREQIDAWFDQHTTLGFSCFVQSPLAQANTHRERGRFRHIDDEELKGGFWDNPPEGLESAAYLEGHMIEAYRIIHRRLPPWNKVGGLKTGAAAAAAGSGDGLLLLMEASYPALFRARRTIRQLADDANAAAFESRALHPARSMALQGAVSDRAGTPQIIHAMNTMLADPLYQTAGYGWEVESMLQSGYLDDLESARAIHVPRP